jgi:UDP-2,3-diacylglucosamine pyrophosphatase LpxH
VRINGWLSWLRRRLNRPGYWSLAGYAKRKVKTAVSFIFDFEDSVIHAARERGVDGVICGHIHSATVRQAGGITYINCGDWVDSCTAIVEHLDGRMDLIHHAAPQYQPAAMPVSVPANAKGVPPREAEVDIAVATARA